MKIGIFGTGNIGGDLGEICTKKGRDVPFGSRTPVNVKPMEPRTVLWISIAYEEYVRSDIVLKLSRK